MPVPKIGPARSTTARTKGKRAKDWGGLFVVFPFSGVPPRGIDRIDRSEPLSFLMVIMTGGIMTGSSDPSREVEKENKGYSEK
jgi:hypothetical protein